MATAGSIAYLGLFLAALLVLTNLSPSWPGGSRSGAEPPVRAATELKAAPTQDGQPENPPALEVPPAEFLRVLARSNIRGAPSLTAPVVGKAVSGERLEFVSKDGRWFLLAPSNGYAEGYIHESVVKRALVADPSGP